MKTPANKRNNYRVGSLMMVVKFGIIPFKLFITLDELYLMVKKGNLASLGNLKCFLLKIREAIKLKVS